MAGVRIAVPLLLVLLTPSLGMSQPHESFQDLALRVDIDDRLWIDDQSGVRTTGRLTRLTRDEITIRTDAGEQRFASAAIRTIVVRRAPRRAAVLLGAGLGAAAGALAACTGSDREECADAPILLGGVGAGVGLALSSLVGQSTTVYPPPIGEPASRSFAEPQGPFDDLALRVNLGDRLRVEDASGVRTTGRLTRLTGGELTIESDAGERRFTSATVREVAVRGYSLGAGTLIGAVVLPVVLAASPGCRSDPDCMPIAAAPFGAGVGLAVGALIPRLRTVFRVPQSSFSPVFSRGNVGVRATLHW